MLPTSSGGLAEVHAKISANGKLKRQFQRVTSRPLIPLRNQNRQEISMRLVADIALPNLGATILFKQRGRQISPYTQRH